MAGGVVAVVADYLFIPDIYADGRAAHAHAAHIQDPAGPDIYRNLAILGQG